MRHNLSFHPHITTWMCFGLHGNPTGNHYSTLSDTIYLIYLWSCCHIYSVGAGMRCDLQSQEPQYTTCREDEQAGSLHAAWIPSFIERRRQRKARPGFHHQHRNDAVRVPHLWKCFSLWTHCNYQQEAPDHTSPVGRVLKRGGEGGRRGGVGIQHYFSYCCQQRPCANYSPLPWLNSWCSNPASCCSGVCFGVKQTKLNTWFFIWVKNFWSSLLHKMNLLI